MKSKFLHTKLELALSYKSTSGMNNATFTLPIDSGFVVPVYYGDLDARNESGGKVVLISKKFAKNIHFAVVTGQSSGVIRAPSPNQLGEQQENGYANSILLSAKNISEGGTQYNMTLFAARTKDLLYNFSILNAKDSSSVQNAGSNYSVAFWIDEPSNHVALTPLKPLNELRYLIYDSPREFFKNSQLANEINKDLPQGKYDISFYMMAIKGTYPTAGNIEVSKIRLSYTKIKQ